jgi:hypothetical protein
VHARNQRPRATAPSVIPAAPAPAAAGARRRSTFVTAERVDRPRQLAQVVGGEPVSRCKNEPQTQPTERRTAWTVVGEFNNAYNDGTRGRFSYRFHRVGIDYRVGDDRHRAFLAQGFQVCVTPRGRPTIRRCPLPRTPAATPTRVPAAREDDGDYRLT